MLVAAAIILPAITPVPTFAETEKPVWDVQELYKQCKYKGSLEKIFCLEFVSNAARQVFTNGLALKGLERPPGLAKIAIPSACPKSFVSMMQWLRLSTNGQTNILKDGVQARTQE